MRKLIVSMNLSLDGYLSRSAGELDWHVERWTGDMAEALCRQLAVADTLLLGRVTYEAMAAYWQVKAMSISCAGEEPVLADMMHHHTKIVVSCSLNKTAWNNTIVWHDAISKRLRNLKGQGSKDIIMYGSATLFSTLPEQLIDEYHLWIHPVAIGQGKSLFRHLRNAPRFKLIRTRTFRSGVVLLSYQRIGDEGPGHGALNVAAANDAQ